MNKLLNSGLPHNNLLIKLRNEIPDTQLAKQLLLNYFKKHTPLSTYLTLTNTLRCITSNSLDKDLLSFSWLLRDVKDIMLALHANLNDLHLPIYPGRSNAELIQLALDFDTGFRFAHLMDHTIIKLMPFDITEGAVQFDLLLDLKNLFFAAYAQQQGWSLPSTMILK